MIDNIVARLTRRDRDLLLALREHAIVGFAPYEVIDHIERKLALAVVLAETESRPECVQIGSELVFRAGPSSVVSAKLVLSPGRAIGPGHVVVTTPLGLALLGMPAGATLSVEEPGPAIRIDAVKPPVPLGPGMATSVCDFMQQNTQIHLPK